MSALKLPWSNSKIRRRLNPFFGFTLSGLKDGVMYKHWVIWVEYPPEHPEAEARHFMCNVRGSSGIFHYEQGLCNARTSADYFDELLVGTIPENQARRFRRAVRQVDIDNSNPTWNCQDFVYQALIQVYEMGLLNMEDEVTFDMIVALMDGVE